MADDNKLSDALNQISQSQETEPAEETDITETEPQETETQEEETETEQTSTEDDSASGEESKKEESEDTTDSESSEDEETPKKKDPENTQPMRQLRNQYRETKNKLDEHTKALEKIAKLQGLTPDELLQKLEDQTDEELAKKNNISPEVQKKLRQQEERINEVEEDRRRSAFMNRVNALKQTRGLQDDQVEDFVRKSYENGFDIMNENVNMELVYNAVYHDDQIAKIREEERQKVYKELEKQRSKSPTQTKRSGTGQEGKITDVNEALKNIEL